MANMSKQDKQGARTLSDLERKYQFGKTFAEVIGVATDAHRAAAAAASGIDGLDQKLSQAEIFNRLTNNGQLQGIYRGDDGEIYINASYIVSGELKADVIKSGVIRCVDENGAELVIDLNGGFIFCGEEQDFASMYSGSFDARKRNLRSSQEGDGFYVSDMESENWFRAGLCNGRSLVTGLTAPVDDSDAANKAYVDALAARVAALEAAINS